MSQLPDLGQGQIVRTPNLTTYHHHHLLLAGNRRGRRRDGGVATLQNELLTTDADKRIKIVVMMPKGTCIHVMITKVFLCRYGEIVNSGQDLKDWRT